MRLYPALRITFFETPRDDQIEQLIARLDDYRPTALEEIPKGVLAYFGAGEARDEALAHFGAFELVDVVAQDVPDENWAERSQAALTPVTVGRLTISPPWCVTDELRARAPGPIIVIQPSMGFGTGHHASTRLCLELLQRLPLEGKRVLDIGTGSGVLAIAAHALGACKVVGIDVDPDALDNARDNLALNSIVEEVVLEESDAQSHLRSEPAPYDVVLANLTGALLVREVDRITQLSARPASLIVSGFQTHEADEISAAFGSAAWALEARAEADSWVAATFSRG